MGRLYTEPEVKDFRGLQSKDYLEKVVKIVPSEFIIIYLSTGGVIDLLPVEGIESIIQGVVFLFLLVLIPVYFKKISATGSVRNHSIVSCLAFILWVYSISGEKLLGNEFYDTRIASLALMLFTFGCNYVPLDK